MSESVISLKNVYKTYGKKSVLRDVNLTINRGDVYGLVGKNGSGKTTMFKLILGLSDFSAGEIQIGAEGDTLQEGRSKTGFMIGQNFFPYLTAQENLEYYRRLKGIKDKGEVERVLKLVELDGVKSKAGRFSLGMKQRLGIANALLGNPEIIILDEPANGLDPQGIADIRKLVKKLNEEYGITVIISSHILEELQHTATRFGILNDGRIIKELSQGDLVLSNNTVKIAVDDLERTRQVLGDAGIHILEETVESRSLEDYYFELIGGDKNA